MNLTDIISADLQSIEADLGCNAPTFTWEKDGQDYFCLPSSNTDGGTLDDGGFELSFDLVLSVRANQFNGGITPLKQQNLTYRNKPYKILKVSQDLSKALLRIYCESPYRTKG